MEPLWHPGELNPEASDARDLPDSHLGTSEREVRLWVEQMAKSLGYAQVVWDSMAAEHGR
jgi:hypothetical protein